jgi:uncharacterized protein (TIGR03084 family)
MRQQAEELRTEGRALLELLRTLAETDWQRPTLFKAWTPDDIIQHLHSGDERGVASISDPEQFDRLVDQMRAMRAPGKSRLEETRKFYGDLRGQRLLEAWHGQLERLCDLIATLAPQARLKWSGPSMGARSFTSARQMEVWAHGQAIYDLLGESREPTDRLRNIAELGVRTFGWTFTNRRQPIPEPIPCVRLHAPSGALWEWNDAASAARVEGPALAFCQVVAQTRNVADTELVVIGDAARRWMQIAQCFAGPPEDPPAPGSRIAGRER